MNDGGASAAAAQQRAIAKAVKASGAIVRLNPEEFSKILYLQENPLIVLNEVNFLGKRYKYLTGYKGLVFYCKSPTPLELPSMAEVISADKIWIPS